MSPFVRHPSVQHSDRVLARSVLALVLAVLTATFAGLPTSPNDELAYQATRSLAHGELALGETLEARRLVERGGGFPLREAGGEAYLCTGLGHVALGVPLYGVGRLLGLALPELERRHREEGHRGHASTGYLPHLLVGWRNALLTALTAWMLVLVTRRLGVARRYAWVAGLSYVLTTFAWAQGRAASPQVTGAFLLLAAFHLTLRARERFERLERPRRGELLGIGLALALAWTVGSGLRVAVIVLAATAEIVLSRGHRYLATRRWTPRRGPTGGSRAVGVVLAPVVIAVASQAWLDHLRFGVWMDPCGLDWIHGRARGAGLGELLLSPGRGLLWTAPLVLLAPLGAWAAWKGGERLYPRALGVLTLALVVPELLMPDPGGRWSFGPRPLLPLLPFLWIGVGLGLGPAVQRRWSARCVALLVVFGVVVQLPSALVDETTYADLARRAAVEVWPPEVIRNEDELWERVAWHPGFAAPWAHWRILRRRVAGLGERYPAREVFLIDSDTMLAPGPGQPRGFAHLAWTDLVQRLGGTALPGVLGVLALLATGAVLAGRGLDPGRE